MLVFSDKHSRHSQPRALCHDAEVRVNLQEGRTYVDQDSTGGGSNDRQTDRPWVGLREANVVESKVAAWHDVSPFLRCRKTPRSIARRLCPYHPVDFPVRKWRGRLRQLSQTPGKHGHQVLVVPRFSILLQQVCQTEKNNDQFTVPPAPAPPHLRVCCCWFCCRGSDADRGWMTLNA